MTQGAATCTMPAAAAAFKMLRRMGAAGCDCSADPDCVAFSSEWSCMTLSFLWWIYDRLCDLLLWKIGARRAGKVQIVPGFGAGENIQHAQARGLEKSTFWPAPFWVASV